MFKYLASATAALSLVAVPVAAAAAPANPAASLSLSNSARASAPSKNASKFSGGVLFAVLIAAGVAAILVIDGTRDDNSDSN